MATSLLFFLSAVVCLAAGVSADCVAASPHFEFDVDYHNGQGLGHGPGTCAIDCCEQCANATWSALGCLYFSYGAGECWFKTSNSGRRSSLGVVSGSCDPAAPTPPPLPAQCPSTTRLNVACVGDSITEGSHSGGDTYPKQLQALLDAAGSVTEGKYCVTNLGRSGNTVQKAPHGDAPYWSSSQYAGLITRKWDVVIIMLGTNDAKDACGAEASFCHNTTCCNWPHDGSNTRLQSGITWTQDCEDMSCPFVQDYSSLINVVKTLGTTDGGPVIYTAIPPPLMQDFSKPYGMNQTVINSILPRIISRINEASGLPHPPIDVFGALGGTSNMNCGYTKATASLQNLCNHTCVDSSHNAACHLFCDGQSCDPCHPNADGYGILAKTVFDAVFSEGQTFHI